MAAVLDRHDCGIVVLRRDQTILFKNAAAANVLRDGVIVETRSGSLRPTAYHDAVRFCRDEPEFGCDFCDFTGGVDFGDEGGFEVVTQLFSTTNKHSVRLKVRLPHDEPSVPTQTYTY